jgi:hypothetical protein
MRLSGDECLPAEALAKAGNDLGFRIVCECD